MRAAATTCFAKSGQSVLLLVAVTVIGGCAAMDSYNQAGRYTAPGGGGDQQKAAAQAELQNARQQSAGLQADVALRQREIQQINERLRASEFDLAAQSRALDEAIRARRVSQAQADPLRKEIENIRIEMQKIDALNKATAAAKPDPAADEAKRKRLADLDGRRKALEATLAQMGGASR